MTLGERCDEILRLIDETLADLTAAPTPTPALIRRPAQPDGRHRS
jgi:hypothetical protein